MIQITWNNLVPPDYTHQEILNEFLKPAVFDNPELGQAIRTSPYFIKDTKKREKETIEVSLMNNKAACSRLFKYDPKQSLNDSEKLLHLLVVRPGRECIPYAMDTYPIRHAFKEQWKRFFDDSSVLYQNFSGNRDDLLDDYKKYIRLFFDDSYMWETFEAEAKLDTLKQKKKEKRDFTGGVSIALPYNGSKIHLSDLLKAIETADYQQSPYDDERKTPGISDENNLFFERMATLSVVATVWNIFIAITDSDSQKVKKNIKQDTQNILALIRMIFPQKKIRELFPHPSETMPSNQSANIPATADHSAANAPFNCKTEDNKAREMLNPVPGYINAGKFCQAGEICKDVYLEFYSSASDQVLADALNHLYTCCTNGYRIPDNFTSIEDIKERADHYGNIYTGQKRAHIKAVPPKTKGFSTGFFTFNCENSISEWIEKSKPESWVKTVSDKPETTLRPDNSQRILLINDDFSVNLQDALNILDAIKESISEKKETTLSSWANFELYIRCNETDATALLDTALSYFTEDSQIQNSDPSSFIKVYCMDEAKRSADYLFARHPLFYPLTISRGIKKVENTADESDSPKNIPTEDDHKLHVIILSDNPNHNYAKWLIKEAFWLLPRMRQKIATQITLISPTACDICDAILTDCPGLASFSSFSKNNNMSEKRTTVSRESENIKIAEIDSLEIHYKDTSFSDRSLLNTLWSTYATSDYLYFIVDSANDIESIQLATRVRELSIRKSVTDGQIGSYSKKNFLIAVHCTNPDYSGLAKDLIIPKEPADGDQWFNNYHFIPFGSMDQLYSWDELNGGIIEELSQCVHLQYCESSVEKERCKENLKSYFEKLYNRDSSFSAAISLPYRLFEADIYPTESQIWDIQDPDAWWKEENRLQMAETYRDKMFQKSSRFSKFVKPDVAKVNEALRLDLAKYEQMRWCCYQLTRGWLPIDPTTVLQYMRNGVNRHVLQIAKLHPCICSWNGLKQLHSSLSNAAASGIWSKNIDALSKEEIEPLLDKKFKEYYAYDGDYSYFQTLNFDNIEKTADILKNKWHTDELFLSSDEIDR
ncbi:hypothetical protein [uncultured Eubacterium sp.]|uniref:hypothetical protein n=1 Tax=uncultured Eubacterium sp. TaxID=165185 RepID=UPI0026006492|nr:hypothetical protein [uncultured Eubacterium sp.]